MASQRQIAAKSNEIPSPSDAQCYPIGWKITGEDEATIAKPPETACETSLKQDGSLQEGLLHDRADRSGHPA